MTRLLVLVLLLFGGSSHAATVFYLHGKIVEDHGDNAVHPRYGAYEYSKIVSALERAGHTVVSEVRVPGTDRGRYAAKVISSIKVLLRNGTPPQDIVVVGFSKGAQIAVLVSQQLANPDVRFVFQAVCGSWVSGQSELRVYGDILSLYESSDAAGSCEDLFQKSSASTCEISLSTGLEHGAFYRPIPAWLDPQQRWIEEGACDPG